MCVLLDECIDEALRHGVVGHDCQTTRHAGLKIAVVVLQAPTTNLDDLLALMPDALQALDALRPGDVICITGR